MGNKIKYILIAVGVVIVIFLFYAFFLKSAPAPVGLTTTVASNDSDTVATLQLLDQMKSLALDRSIFTNPLYLHLQDFGVTISPQPYGRPNPFGPIGTDASTTTAANPAGAPAAAAH